MATKKKALKKSKLRHAEYYDFQKIQDKLYAESMDGKMFTKLVEIITLPENIKLAYRNIKKNKGSKTAGTDGKTIQHLEKLSEEKLVVLVQRKFSWYVPQSVRRVEIPKDNGKTRPLGIPTIMDRLVQQCVLQVLEPICEAKFHDHSYGFRPNRSQQHAISQVHKNMQLSHLHYVVDIDIKGFFDNVSHGKLLKQLWTLGICDKKLISIISAMLKAEVAGIGFPEKGTPQGGIISPLLSNIVLNELDWWLASQWENIPTQYPFKQTPNRNGSPNHGNKYASLRRSGLKEITCVRYADDFKIFTSSYPNAVKGKDPVQIGSYRGFTMSVAFDSMWKTYTLTLKGQMTHRVELGSDARGNLVRIENALDKMPERLRSVQEQLENLYNQQAASKAEVGKPFPQEQELAAKTARLIELDMELNLDGKGQPQPEQAIAKSTRPSVLDRLKAPPVHGAPEKPHKKEMEAR